MLTAGGNIGDRTSRPVLVAMLTAVLVLVVLSGFEPGSAHASVTSGALSQLTGEFNCVGEETVVSEGNACGTRVEEGTHDVFQVQVSPDGRNAYSIAIN